MLFNKKGQDLSMTTVVVVILALLVLVIVAFVFLGGSINLGDAFNKLVRPQKAVSYELAINTCKNWCNIAESLDVSDQSKSSFCKSYQDGVDEDRDGEPDREGDKVLRSFCNGDAMERAGTSQDPAIPLSSLEIVCNAKC